MRAAACLIILTILMPWLSACDPERPAPVAAIQMVQGKTTPEARRAEIKRQLSRICPVPLSDDALERAARYVETHRDKDALAIVNELSRLDAEARVCRGTGGQGRASRGPARTPRRDKLPRPLTPVSPLWPTLNLRSFSCPTFLSPRSLLALKR
jgi:hypothetical protein